MPIQAFWMVSVSPRKASPYPGRVYVGRMQLTRGRITDAALRILAEYGLADVSMRRVATSLGVAPGALYWHFESKQELIASLAEAIVQPLFDDPLPDPARLSSELRAAVLAVRDGAEVVVAAVSQPGARVQLDLEARFVASVRGLLGEAASIGNAMDKVHAGARGLLHLTLGNAAVHQSAAQLAQATGSASSDDDGSAEHAAAVAFLLEGLKRSE